MIRLMPVSDEMNLLESDGIFGAKKRLRKQVEASVRHSRNI
jgi:hypothetical protein